MRGLCLPSRSLTRHWVAGIMSNFHSDISASIWRTSDNIFVSEEDSTTALQNPHKQYIFHDIDFDDMEFVSTAQPSFVEDEFGDFGELVNGRMVSFSPDAAKRTANIFNVQSRECVRKCVHGLLDAIWTDIGSSVIMIREDIKQMEGLNQALITPERYAIQRISSTLMSFSCSRALHGILSKIGRAHV